MYIKLATLWATLKIMDLTPEEMMKLQVDSYKIQANMERMKLSDTIAE